MLHAMGDSLVSYISGDYCSGLYIVLNNIYYTLYQLMYDIIYIWQRILELTFPTILAER